MNILKEFEKFLEVRSLIFHARDGTGCWVGIFPAAHGHGTDRIESELDFAVLEKVHEPISIFDQDR